jgi:hypothetical protein
LLAAHRPKRNNTISLKPRTPPSPLGVPIDFACSRSSTGSPESSAACGRCKSTVPTGRSAIALHHPAHDHSTTSTVRTTPRTRRGRCRSSYALSNVRAVGTASFTASSQSIAHRIAQAIDGILNLAHSLVGFAVVLQLGVADSLANGLFRGAFDFLDRTGDSVLCR